MHIDRQARIVHKYSWGSYFRFSFKTPPIASDAHPGQFVMVRVSNQNFPLLRRPFSIHDRDVETVDIFFQKTGLGTDILSRKEAGESLDLLGPLGQGFSCDDRTRGKKAVLVGGGRGIAPLFFLARELDRRGAEVRVHYGGKTKDDLPLIEKFKDSGLSFLCSTDDGSYGHHGLVTELLEAAIEREKPVRIYACGPEAMLEKTGRIAETFDIEAELSLESVMGCGFGACWGCVKKVRDAGNSAWVKICEKGPVFPSRDIVWRDGER
jgi:dihydroorotate dehydrogenase electron transfer subunit